jgi:hypothetical protein
MVVSIDVVLIWSQIKLKELTSLWESCIKVPSQVDCISDDILLVKNRESYS